VTPSSLNGDRIAGESFADTHAVAFSSWLQSKERSSILQRTDAKKRRSDRGTALVVVVDDEPVVAITLAEILQRRGVNAVWFTQPLCALEYAQDGTVDLLLSDFTMPLMDGVLLAQLVLECNPNCALFMLSAVCDQPEVAARMLSVSPDVHIEAKPAQIPRIVSIVEGLLSRHSVCASLRRIAVDPKP
jgi:DNA-binding response OmpR family regulator